MESSLALHYFGILLTWHPKMEILDLARDEPEKHNYHILQTIVPLIFCTPPLPLSSMYITLYKLYIKLLFMTQYISEFVSSCTFQQYIIHRHMAMAMKQLIL